MAPAPSRPAAPASGAGAADERPADREPLPPQPELTPAQERAKKIRYLVNARESVKRLEKQGDGGKNAEALAENRKVLAELERWASRQAITAEELAHARQEIERERKRERRDDQRPRSER